MNRKRITIILCVSLLLSMFEALPNAPSLAHAAGDFTVTANPSNVGPISTEGSGSTTIIVAANPSFTGTIKLADMISPQTGVTAGLSSTSVSLSTTTTTATSILSVNGSAVGKYTVTVTGTSGSLVHSAQVTVTVTLGGLICLASSTGVPPPPANPCPAAPGPVLRGVPPTTPPNQLRVGVYINGSDPLNTFDITLFSDHTILLPVDTSLVGSIFPGSPSIDIKCIGGKNEIGSSPCPPTDNADTLHFAVSIAGLTTKPTTGLLFIAIYNITGSTTIAGITIDYQTGCPSTSVTGKCVVVGNGTPIPVDERAQGCFFSDAPDFTITASSTLLSFASTLTGTSTITAKSLSTFAGTISLTAVTNSSNLSVSPASQMLTLSSGGTKQAILTFSSSVVANYTATITGTSGAISHSVNITVIVVPRFDFSISTNPAVVTFDNGTSGTSIITATSVTGFTGFVDISTSISPTTGLSVSYNTTSLKLIAQGSTNSSLATFSSSTPGDYLVSLTGRNGTSQPIHHIFIPVHVADYYITAIPQSVILYVGALSNSTIGVASKFNFGGVVSLSAAPNTTGLTANLADASLSLRGGGTNSTLLFLSGSFGNYTVKVTGTSGPLSHQFTLSITVRHPDFGITSNPSHVVTLLSSSNSTTIIITRLGSFNGTIALSTMPSIGGVTNPLSPTTVTLNATTRGDTSKMNFTVSNNAIPGNYTLTVTGINATGSPNHTTTVLLTILKPDFVPILTANSFTIDIGQNASSILEVFSKNNFAGTINLTASVTPAGLTTSFNQTKLVLVFRGVAAANITISAPVGTAAGNYTVTITQTSIISGVISVHNSTLTLVVGDFQIAILTPTITVGVGFGSNANITLSSINHFNGNVTLTPSSNTLYGLPSLGTVLLTQSRTEMVTVLVTAPNNTRTGTYIMTVTGTIGPLSRSITITVTVILHDVAITSVTFSPASGVPGATINFTIRVANQGNVTEQVTVDAIAGYISVAQENLTLQAGTRKTITLTWKTDGFNPGNYVLGAKVHRVRDEATTANNILTATPSFTLNSPPTPLISQGLILDFIVIGVIAAIAVAAFLLLRRRKPPKTV